MGREERWEAKEKGKEVRG